MVFSLRDTRPQPEPAPEEKYTPLSEDIGPLSSEDPLLRAASWSELYRTDFEYEAFWDWFDRRNDPMRTDRLQLLSEIPLHFAPTEVPPPLRRHFVKGFNDGS